MLLIAISIFSIDCRNGYESDCGTFAGAVPLQTGKFSETWDALNNILKDVEPDRRILTFCTGGIRCVKVNAYLKQQMGFNNVGRLEKGIIAYEKWVTEQGIADNAAHETNTEHAAQPHQPVESLFLGENFLFDRRRLMNNSTGNDSTSK